MDRDFDFSELYQPLFEPVAPTRYFIVTGGRGSGKSFAVAASACLDLTCSTEEKNILYLRQTLVILPPLKLVLN